MNRGFALIAATLLAACRAPVPQSPAPESAAPRPDTLRVEQVAKGVSYEYRWYREGPALVHWLSVDPRACGVEFRTMKALDHVIGRAGPEAMARATAESSGRPVIAAVNADFFAYQPPGISEGPQMSNGRIIKSGGTWREALEDRVLRLQPVAAFAPGGKAFLAHTQLRAFVHAGARNVRLAGINIATLPDRTYMFDSFLGDTTATDSTATEIVLRNFGNPDRWQRAGVVTALDTLPAGVAIPKDGFVVALRGASRGVLGHIEPGDTLRISIAFDSLPANITEMIGGYPMLLVHGKAVHHDETGLRPTFSDRGHPRTAIGWGRDGRIHIVVVDGRKPGVSAGMTLHELAEYLRANGITEAMNFDGGGSSTMVLNGRIANQSADPTGERAVANALAVLGPAPGTCR